MSQLSADAILILRCLHDYHRKYQFMTSEKATQGLLVRSTGLSEERFHSAEAELRSALLIDAGEQYGRRVWWLLAKGLAKTKAALRDHVPLTVEQERVLRAIVEQAEHEEGVDEQIVLDTLDMGECDYREACDRLASLRLIEEDDEGLPLSVPTWRGRALVAGDFGKLEYRHGARETDRSEL